MPDQYLGRRITADWEEEDIEADIGTLPSSRAALDKKHSLRSCLYSQMVLLGGHYGFQQGFYKCSEISGAICDTSCRGFLDCCSKKAKGFFVIAVNQVVQGGYAFTEPANWSGWFLNELTKKR